MKQTLTLTIMLISISLSFAQKNNIKLNLTNLGFGHATLAYERAVAKNHSLGIQLGYHTNSKTISNSAIEPLTKETFSIDYGLNGYSAILEYRYYPGKRYAPRGFYLSPYIKYSFYEAGVSTKIADFNTTLKGEVKNFGPGLMIGYQVRIKKRISLDLYFLGFTVSNTNFSVDYSSSDINVDYEAIADDVRKEVKDVPFVGDDTTVTVKPNGVDLTSDFLGIYPRFGLSIGILLGKPHDQIQNQIK